MTSATLRPARDRAAAARPRRRRGRFLLLLLPILCAAAYIVWPFLTAWSIRAAIREDDADFLEEAIEWDSVKATLKPSLLAYAVPPPPETADEPGRPPSLWKRAKTYYARSTIDRLVESYVTPAGLPDLFRKARFWRETVRGRYDDSASLPWKERLGRAWHRVKRAEFMSLTRLEFTVEDRFNPGRLYSGALELKGSRWKLTELTVSAAPTPLNLDQAATE